MSKTPTQDKIGRLRLTETEREDLFEFMETSPVWQIIKKYRRHRNVKIPQLTVRTGQTAEDLWFGRGQLHEADAMVNEFEKLLAEDRKAQAKSGESDDE